MKSSGAKPKILVVDDSATDVLILSESLKADYQVYAAANGNEALKRMASNPSDLILLDIAMPGMSGKQVCRKLKADPATRDIPVIFITGMLEEQDEAEAFALGAADYITKPIRTAVVQARVASVLRLKRETELRMATARELDLLNESLTERVESQVAQLRHANDLLSIANKRSKSSEELLLIILENISDLIFLTDDDGNFTFISKNVSIMLGYPMEKLWSMGNVAKLCNNVQCTAHELNVKGSLTDIEHVIIDNDGNPRTYLINIKRVFIGNGTRLWSCREISERKKLENRLQHTYKMEAIGTLAGGIAHDFNNILSAIVGYTEISRHGIEEHCSLYKNLTCVMDASWRAKDLVNQILLFSREREQEFKPIKITLPIKEALRLIRASVPATIEICPEIQSDAVVMADPTQIHQLVMNLCTNAAHAMRETGGTLTVRLCDQMITSDLLATYPDLTAGAYIKMSVCDTGHGIQPQLINRVFDPFFSTKSKGEGTGMGLSVVHGIVKSHGGGVFVHSQVAKGTTFDILLPLLEKLPAAECVVQDPIPRGTERILFVDDETMIVDIAKTMLASLGYQIETKTRAVEALTLFNQKPNYFDAVITDLTMPKMTGLALAEKLRQARSDIPIILCTGFSADIDEQTQARCGIKAMVFKPILMRDIAVKLRAALDGKANTDQQR